MIERFLFDQLLRYLAIFPVVVLTGPRNAGKSLLASNTIKWFGRQSTYLDLEFGPDLVRLDNVESFFDRHSNQLIVFDEVHRKQELFVPIRRSIDDNGRSGQFLLITSSPSGRLRKKMQALSGKIGYIVLHPLDRLEVIDDHGLDDHWLKGGFPGAYFEKDGRLSFIWRDNLLQTVCERDLPQMGLAVKSDVIRTFLTMIASDQGSIWNASNVARSLGITSPTITKYLRFLEDSFLVTSLRPFKIDSGKRLVNASKIYIADSGILHSLLHIEAREDLENHIISGRSWEGYVVTQIQSVLARKAEVFFYMSHQGARVDVLIVQNNNPLISGGYCFEL